MQIVTALDGSLVRNLRLSPGDEVTLDLTVYEHDGDTSPLAYTDPQMSVGGGSLYPIGTEFTVSLTLGRTPYQLAVQIDGVTTTVAYGIIETTMPGSCSIVCGGCCPSGTIAGPGSGGIVFGPPDAVSGNVAIFDGVTGRLIADSGLTIEGENTGDQTSIVGISGTLAEFNAALTDENFATGGGTVTGSSSGTNTGDQSSVTGNAGTATALQTARNINGTSFNGTADITVTADAGTLTGATLAAGVTASSLTSVGTLTSLTVSGQILGKAGAAGSPSLSFSGDPDTGFYSFGANAIGLAIGGVTYGAISAGAMNMFMPAAFASTLSVTNTISFGPFTTGTEPAYVKGASYFNTTLNKLRIGGASAWETVTSV